MHCSEKNGNECIICATDNNGKVARDTRKNEQNDTGEEEEDKEETIEQKNEVIGNWAYSKKQKKEMARNAKNIAQSITYG